jgi:hypothetical protein
MKQLHEVSPRLEARVAGTLYLSSILLGVAAMIFNSRNLQALSGPTTVVAGVFYTGLTVLLWDLLRPERVAFDKCRNIQLGGLLAPPVVVPSGAHQQLRIFRHLLPVNRLLNPAVAVSSKCSWCTHGLRGCWLADHNLAVFGPCDFALPGDCRFRG